MAEPITGIDPKAPVKASAELEVAAPPDVVWALLSDFARWPEWNPAVSDVQVDGPLTPGTVFRWKTGAATITSTLQHVAAPTYLVWTGRTKGISAVHVYRLTPSGAGTLVATEESWSGLLPRLFSGGLRRNLTVALGNGLQVLKRAAEGRSGAMP